MKIIDEFLKNINENKNNISKFLSEEEQILLKKVKNKFFFPEFCERKRVIIYNNIDDFNINDYISVIKIDYNKKFGEITHRDVLGSLMGLGIKRECVGDIIVDDNIYVFVIKEMEKYVLNNLITIGKVSVNVNIISIDDIKNINFDKYIEDTIIVSSYRLDNIISERCAFSREKAKLLK